MVRCSCCDYSSTCSAPAPLFPASRFFYTLLAQCGIVVTGALVRLTGSGLGCPIVARVHDRLAGTGRASGTGWHKYIEFGNRLLTFVLLIACVASLVVALRASPRQRRVVNFSALGLAGVAVQAILGGITVLAGLPADRRGSLPRLVHLIISRTPPTLKQGGPGQPSAGVVAAGGGWILAARMLGRLLCGGALLIPDLLGTIVTGSGPHSGDSRRRCASS